MDTPTRIQQREKWLKSRAREAKNASKSNTRQNSTPTTRRNSTPTTHRGVFMFGDGEPRGIVNVLTGESYTPRGVVKQPPFSGPGYVENASPDYYQQLYDSLAREYAIESLKTDVKPALLKHYNDILQENYPGYPPIIHTPELMDKYLPPELSLNKRKLDQKEELDEELPPTKKGIFSYGVGMTDNFIHTGDQELPLSQKPLRYKYSVSKPSGGSRRNRKSRKKLKRNHRKGR
jgi:hypothetical protein